MKGFVALVERDARLAFRAGGGAVQAVMFFLLTIIIFAIAVGPDLALLSRIAAPVVWATLLLATLVTLDRLFQADFEDGSLDSLAQGADMLGLVVLAKAVAHWITTSLPLIAATPLVGVLLGLPIEGYWPLMASLAIGSPALSLTGALAAALTLSLRRATVLMTVFAAPLFAPVLIFGVGAAEAGAAGDPRFIPSLLLLGATSLLSLVIAPLAGAAAIRVNLG